MPEDSRKNQQKKNRNEPKEQRKLRQGRNQATIPENKIEKKLEEPKVPKVPAPEKTVYKEPPPEFYKNLKRETEEILKITEEANLKYKKKEITSNWAKYEMPIESYQEIEEQENMGADYEKLIQAPHSIGGHFQFKHEKSWDLTTGPSLYDKYFDINMDKLMNALSSVPFYDRNNIDKSVFSEADILTMNNRSTRFKQKYYNDKSYTTPELETQDKILNALKEDSSKSEEKDIVIQNKYCDDEPYNSPELEIQGYIIKDNLNISERKEETVHENKNTNTENEENNICLESKPTDKESILYKDNKCQILNKTETIPSPAKILKDNIQVETHKRDTDKINLQKTLINKPDDDFDDIILGDVKQVCQSPIKEDIIEVKKVEPAPLTKHNKLEFKAAESPVKEEKKNPVIESPDDLEKWLDDFLDG